MDLRAIAISKAISTVPIRLKRWAAPEPPEILRAGGEKP
jgi:hypothetical protein